MSELITDRGQICILRVSYIKYKNYNMRRAWQKLRFFKVELRKGCSGKDVERHLENKSERKQRSWSALGIGALF